MHLDHVTLLANDIEGLCAFFVDIVGLEIGARPPFRVNGYWLYLDGRPVVHLVYLHESVTPDTAAPVPRFDHVAFRLANQAALHELMSRLTANNIAYQTAEIPQTGEHQVFVQFSPVIAIEFITSVSRV